MNQEVMTRTELNRLGLDALDKGKVGLTSISQAAGGVSFIDAAQVMEFAKLMAVADKAVPKHLRANPGACLRIVFQAIEWRMSPWAVADKSYEVNDRIAYESQLIHAVIEARAPLQHRLECDYVGEYDEKEMAKSTRACIIRGKFISGDVREYESPPYGKIRIKNSPLWKDDPDQQLFYYASRAWARKWCPDVLMGIYSREEAQAMQPEDAGPGLHARLSGSPSSDEGHTPGHVESELEQIVAERAEPAVAQIEQGAVEIPPEENKRTTSRPRGKAKAEKGKKARKVLEPQEEIDIRKVTTKAEYVKYADAWIRACTDADGELFVRWTAERKIRNALGLTAEEREPLDKLIEQRREELAE